MEKNWLNITLILIIVGLIGWALVKPENKSETATQNTQTDNYNSDTQKESPMPVSTNSAKKEYKLAGQVVKAGKQYTAVIKTSAGDITVELSKDTPVTTNNFVFLSQEKFYDGVIFHRVIPGFMIQGGDPTGTGMGGPGYKFADEKFTGEYKRGTIAMANSGPNTNGSQFFIMHADYPLPPNYVIFGTTKSGLEVVDKIASGKTGPSDRPVEPVSIKSIEITEK
jgi:cyclophilin family peptidyl-prolyl cis-trans isomerase